MSNSRSFGTKLGLIASVATIFASVITGIGFYLDRIKNKPDGAIVNYQPEKPTESIAPVSPPATIIGRDQPREYTIKEGNSIYDRASGISLSTSFVDDQGLQFFKLKWQTKFASDSTAIRSDSEITISDDSENYLVSVISTDKKNKSINVLIR